MAIFEPHSNTTLNCLPILHELIWIESVLTNHLAQGIAQVITQKNDTVRTGKRVGVCISGRSHSFLSSKVPVNNYPVAFHSRTFCLFFVSRITFCHIKDFNSWRTH